MGITQRLRDIRTAFRPRPWPLERPRVLQFPVNDICNSGCQMCHIWEQKRGREISADEVRRALAVPLFRDVVGVGVNGGEPTLRRDLAEVVEALFDALPRLQGISLITNALVSKVVIPRIREVADVVTRRGGRLDVMVSLDGVGDVHDRVRGRPGNFDNAERVLDYLQGPCFGGSVRLGCTVVRDNVHGLHDLLEYAIERGIYVKYRLGIPHRRLYTDGVEEPFALSPDERTQLCVFLENLVRHYERRPRQRFFYRSLIDQLASGAPRRAGCDWQHRGATLTPRGELAYCAVESRALGSVVSDDAAKIWQAGEPHLREIVERKCDGCTHDYEGLPPGRELVRETLRSVAERAGWVDEGGLRVEARALREPIRRRRFDRRLCALGVEPESPVARPAITRSTPRRAVICGWYGTETLGDKAILAGVVASLRASLPQADLVLGTFDPGISALTASQMPEVADLEIVPADRVASLLCAGDLLVMAGGPLMALDTLAEIEASFTRAAALGIPSMLAGCGVGPRGHAAHDASIRRILELASARVHRDAESLATARGLGVDVADDVVAEDPAFSWLAEHRGARPRKPGPEGEGQRLLLGLREWPYREYQTGRSRRAGEAASRRFESVLVGALAQIVADRPGRVLVPFPMCTNHHGGDDRWFYRRLFRGHDALRSSVDDSALGRELAPDGALEVMRDCDAALAMRFHSLVFASSLGLPTFAIDYSGDGGKVGALARRLGVSHACPDDLDTGSLVEHLRALLDESPSPPVFAVPSFPRVFATALDRILDRV